MIWAVIVVAGFLFIQYFFCLFPSSQWFGPWLYRAITDRKIIALTFDDGPNPPYTNQLLEILRKHEVKATFFLVGKNAEKFPEVVKKMAADGHGIGNHSYSHAFHKYFTEPNFVQEITKTQDILNRLTGKRPTLFRSPLLFRQPWMMKTVKAQDLRAISGAFGGELEVYQPFVKTQALFKRALQKSQPGAILIFHDGYGATGGNRQQTVLAIDMLIPALKAQGYTFVTVDQMLG